jgi:hypothetical protein
MRCLAAILGVFLVIGVVLTPVAYAYIGTSGPPWLQTTGKAEPPLALACFIAGLAQGAAAVFCFGTAANWGEKP